MERLMEDFPLAICGCVSRAGSKSFRNSDRSLRSHMTGLHAQLTYRLRFSARTIQSRRPSYSSAITRTWFPQSGVVKLTTAGGSIAFMANGFVVDIQLVQEIGSTTKHSYQIVGGVFDIHPGRPQTLNQVISTGVAIGLWPTLTVPTPTTLTEVIDAGTTLTLWPSGPVPVTPTTLNEVIAAGTALNLWL